MRHPATKAALKAMAGHYAKPYRFTKDCFTRCIPLWSSVLAPLRGRPGLRYLEVGVFEGGSALWMLENVLTHSTARMTAVDTFLDDLDRGFLANLRLSGLERKVSVLKGPSHEKLRRLPLDAFDVAYIDASAVAEDVMTNAVLAWDALRADGVLIFDDYRIWPRWPARCRPKPAVDAFLSLYGDGLRVLHSSYQVAVRKTRNERKEMLHKIIRSGLCVRRPRHG